MSTTTKIPKRSPWGTVDHATILAPGIVQVSTPGHGGIRLDAKHNAQIPEPLRNTPGWYEEDIEAEIVAYVFPAAFPGEHVQSSAADRIRDWLPAQWEAATGEKVTAEQSHVVAEAEFLADHAADWIGVAAVNDGEKVKVWAKLGGDRSTVARTFLVDPEEYGERGRFGFVIDFYYHPELFDQ